MTVAAAALGVSLAVCSYAARAAPPTPAVLLDWPHPADWKSETIPFPLDFAPTIHHVGVEELRFAPGFFTPAAPGYFSYAFVWWLKAAAPLTAATLAAELNEYYAGLCTQVGEKKFTFDRARYQVKLAPATTSLPGWEALAGEARLYDAFTTGKPLALQLRAYQRDCPSRGQRAVLVLASPQPESAAIWSELRARAAAVRCQ
jgi:hypothetical protein